MKYSQPMPFMACEDTRQHSCAILGTDVDVIDVRTIQLPCIRPAHYVEHAQDAPRMILIAGSDVPPRGNDSLVHYQAIVDSLSTLSEEALQQATRNIPAITATSIFDDQRGTEARKRQFWRLSSKRKRQTHVGAHRTVQDQSTCTTLTYTMVTFLLGLSSLGVLCLTIALW